MVELSLVDQCLNWVVRTDRAELSLPTVNCLLARAPMRPTDSEQSANP